MVNGYSIRNFAKIVGISIPTSFYWRYKILDSVRAYMGSDSIGGIIEVDEIFFRESFKENHKDIKNFSMLRKPHKRGGKGSKPNKGKKKKKSISHLYFYDSDLYYIQDDKERPMANFVKEHFKYEF